MLISCHVKHWRCLAWVIDDVIIDVIIVDDIRDIATALSLSLDFALLSHFLGLFMSLLTLNVKNQIMLLRLGIFLKFDEKFQCCLIDTMHLSNTLIQATLLLL